RSATTRTVWPSRTTPVSESNRRTCWIARPVSGLCPDICRTAASRSRPLPWCVMVAMTAPSVPASTTPARRTLMTRLGNETATFMRRGLRVVTHRGRERQLDDHDEAGLRVVGVDVTTVDANRSLSDGEPKPGAILVAPRLLDPEERLKNAR